MKRELFIEEDFDPLLRLEDRWAIGHSTHYVTVGEWVALHVHKNGDVGWCLFSNKQCNMCGTLFPRKVRGMLNMMNGLS